MIQEADRTDVGPGTIDGINAAFDRLCRDYASADAVELKDGIKRVHGRVMRLRQGRTTLDQHKELIALSGWLTALHSCVDWDMNRREAAETARAAAFQFAREIEHSELTAWSYELEAWFALTEGRYGDVTNIAATGQAISGETSATVQLIMQEARGWAGLNNQLAAEKAMERGYNLLQKLPTANYPRQFVYDKSKFPFYIASCYQWLGDDGKAEEYANQVFRECEQNGTTPRNPMRMADTYIILGLVHARRGNLDGAADSGRRALTYRRNSGPALLTRADELDEAIGDRFPDAPLSFEFHERVKAYREDLEIAAQHEDV